MPLKHHTETAYLLVLGIVICVTGIIVSLFPPLPSSLVAWISLMIITGLYPVALAGTFRSNRADYEFRLLHWFPMSMVLLWGVIDFAAPRIRFMHILELGSFYLWSLPLVVLGLFFIILFATHVIRRRNVRITMTIFFLVLFTAGAITAEARGWNASLQKYVLVGQAKIASTLRLRATQLASLVLEKNAGSGSSLSERLSFMPFFSKQGDATSSVRTSSRAESSASSILSRSIYSSVVQSSSSEARVPSRPLFGFGNKSSAASSVGSASSVSSSKPKKLTKSGPESIALIVATLFGFYCCVLHQRAKVRTEV